MSLRSAVLGAGMSSRLRRHVARLHLPGEPADREPVTESDLAPLPEPAQRYLRFMRVVGRPRDRSFRARFVGQFRMRPGMPFMPCEAWQYNVAPVPARVYYVRIDLAGLVPMFGIDSYVRNTGRMHGKLLGLVTVADGSGHEFDVSELTTYVNDALGFAPSMLLNPAVRWTPADGSSFDVTMTDGPLASTSRVTVDEEGRMLDVSTTDRWADLPGGLTRARWSTPADGWIEHLGRWIPTGGRAVWHFDDGPFEYARGRFVPGTVRFNTTP